MGEAIIMGRKSSTNYAKDWEYTTNDTATLVTKYIGTKRHVIVPNKIEGKPVVLQNNPYSFSGVFTGNKNIISVQFSDGVKIANNNMQYAFYNCYNLASVPFIPNGVTNIFYAFGNCHNLVNAPAIPNSVTDVSSAFRECFNLVNAPVIPNSVKYMALTFYWCNHLINAPIIPNSVTHMTSTFSCCFNLVNAPVIPNSVKYMSLTFDSCQKLVNAPAIPNGVTDMEGTFNSCYNLVNAPAIPNSVTNMGYSTYSSGTFTGCRNLVNAPVIPNSVKYMHNAFYGCWNLVNAPVIPDSVMDVTGTFGYCTNLKGNIYIKSNRINNTSMANCFNGTTLPKNVYIPSTGLDATNNTWNAAFNTTYGINGKNGVTVMDIEEAFPEMSWQYTTNATTALVTKYIGSKTNVVVPNKIEGKNVVIGDIVEEKVYEVFVGNQNIVSVTFSDNVEIANNNMNEMFHHCTNLKGIFNIPTNVINMYNAFHTCTNLVNAPVIPNSVTDMGSTFANCVNLVNAPIIPANVTDMGYTFENCTTLVNAPTIPNSVYQMWYTFYGCTSLINAPILPEHVTLGCTFGDCTNLINIPPLPKHFSISPEGYVFAGCTSLKNAPDMSNVELDGESSFMGMFCECSNLVNAPIIPANVYEMRETFRNCTNLKGNIYIKSNNIRMFDHCFDNTSLPKNVYISKGSNTWNAAIATINGKNGVTVYDIGDTVAGQWQYTTNATSALITKYIGTKTDVVVPYEIDGKNVVLQNSPNSSNGVFTNNKNITSVRFLTDGTKIANSNASNMFANCSNLKGVSIMPNGVTNMSNAFLNCQNLSEAPYIPNSVTNVCNAFMNCHNLQGIVAIPPSVTNMAYVFRGSCPSIQLFIEPTALNVATMNCAIQVDTDSTTLRSPKIYVYNSTTNAPCNTYNYRNCLVKDKFGANITGGKYFHANQMANMDTYTTNYFQVDLGTSGSPSARITDIGSLRSPNLYIPCKITSIYTDKRMSTTIEPKGIRTGYDGPFYNQKTIQTVIFGANVRWGRTNQDGTFWGCTNLRTVKGLPPINSMDGMFGNCVQLTDVSPIPNGVTTMYQTFFNCSSLVYAPVIPNGVTNMCLTFEGCTSLVNVPVIPNGVTTMAGAFTNCRKLVNAPIISNSVTNTLCMFENCTNLVNVPFIPNGPTNIWGMFTHCYNLVNAPVIPNSVTNMYQTFYYCDHLSGNVVIKSNSVANMRNCFDYVQNINVYCPAASDTMSLANTYVKSAGRGNVYDINTYTGTY